ncbi:hypothetical protein NC653_023764 [Populus alba x Populus x berolinensis]|uniref:XS domain-containing protein n=1 Tax=Populus alba x Populus x berolinensis TaxID=444605 RepID=A0AAD6MIP8_9ROSI|nr:hypothetical protein NC653_023764 [Populus alba x Populus x berolinensis]
MKHQRHSNVYISRPLSPPRQTPRCGIRDCELEENRRFSHANQSRSPARRENQQHGNVRTREEVEGNRRFSRSYRSRSPVWSEQHRSGQAGREYQQHGYMKTRTPPRKQDEIEGNRRFSRSHRSRSPVSDEPPRSRQDGREHQQHGDVRIWSPPWNREERVTVMRSSGLNQPVEPDQLGSVHRREGDRLFNEERDEHLEKLSQFCESLSKKGSAFNKFQWDNLLAQENKPQNASANLGPSVDPWKTSGVVSDSGVVPASLSMEYVGPRSHFECCLDATTRGDNHGLIDGGIGNVNVSPFGEPVRKRFERRSSSVIDPIVDKVERNDASVVGHHYVERVRVSHSMRQEEKDVKDCRNDHGDYGVFIRERGNMGSLPMASSFQNMKNVRGKTCIVDVIDGNDAALNDHMRENRMVDNPEVFGERYPYAERVSVFHSMELDGRDKDCRSDPVEYGFIQDKNESHLRKTFVRERANVGSLPMESPCENMSVSRKRTCLVDPIADTIDGNDAALRERMRTSRILDTLGGFQERPINVSRGSLRSFEEDDKDEEALVSSNMYYEMEECLDPENLKSTEECGFEGDGGSIGSCGDGYKRVTVSYDGLYATENSSQRVVMEEQPGIHGQSEYMLDGQHIFDMEASIHDQRSVISSDWNGLEQMHDVGYRDGKWTNQDNEQYSSLENSGLRRLQSGRDGWMIEDRASHEDAYSFHPLPSTDRHLSEPVEPPESNVKQRLGPLRNVKQRLGSVRNVKQRLGSVRNVKQRLGPAQNACKSLGAAQKAQRKLPWVKIYEEQCLYDSDGTHNIQGVKSSEMKKKHANTEASKDSDEFMHLVQRAFLKFSKLLNENSANRRKYQEKGGNANLKCCVCGSNSKDFVDTLSLAQHTVMFSKGSFRAEHLGLHKALCVLMGWNSAGFPNSQWVRQVLPEVEASSLKEDLIIWPPVVVIHNRSIANYNPDERIIVSVEGLRHILRGMGFGQGITNICRGKAANQSTMVVIFGQTFSGLQGAERLHKLYAESKRGRTEFQQIGLHGSLQTQGVSSNTKENVLYGYLGISIDLDKLDFETKKRCVVKSKKEIKAVADFALNTE